MKKKKELNIVIVTNFAKKLISMLKIISIISVSFPLFDNIVINFYITYIMIVMSFILLLSIRIENFLERKPFE